jgi:hypothetical protein
VPSTAGFDRLLLAARQFAVARAGQKAILASKPPGYLANVGLVVVMDWYGRQVLAWRLSNTMDTSFCFDALEDALRKGW